MSAKIKPSFTADGKRYELIYTRALQCEYQRMTDEKKQDSAYQDEIAEYTRLQSVYEAVHEQFLKAQDAYFATPLDKEAKATYKEFKEADKEAFGEFSSYASAHPNGDGSKFVLDCLEKLVIFALVEQHKLSDDDATAVWCKYVEENGQVGAMLFLSTLASAWFTDTSEDEDNPFIKAQMAKVEATNNRRIGLRKINK